MRVSTAQRARDWTGLYVANAFLPFVVGGLVTVQGGFWGMLCALLAVWSAGLVVCTHTVRVSWVLRRGAGIVALCQLFPVLQIGSAYFALWAWDAAGGRLNQGGLMSEVGGFAVTVMTAQPLLLAAFVFGGGLGLLVEWWDDDSD